MHPFATIALSLTLVAALAGCDEQAPTDTDEPVSPSVDQAALVSQGGVSALAIALPVNQDAATTAPAPAFRINQTGTGPNGIFQITRAANTQPALQGLTNGRGRAGFFRISNAGNSQAALLGQTNGTGFGVHGLVTGRGGIAGRFEVNNSGSASPAISASSNGLGAGVLGFNFGTGGAGRFVIFNSSSNANALYVESNTRAGSGSGGGGAAILAVHKGGGSAGTFAIENPSNSSAALFARSDGTGAAAQFEGNSSGYALLAFGRTQLSGNVTVMGTLTKPAGSFRIDHPLDPEHKYLSHSFVESPDMLNVYDGTATLDGRGEAVVMLPTYFEALNRDFRYQLTAIGAPGPNLHIGQKIRNNRFVVAGGVPGAEVSWQVTGVRHDAYAEAHRIQVETDKPAAERGVALAH